jgi:uncharacterized membrane protein
MSNADATALDALPVHDGFRMRGLDMTRIETFTDAAFAFAVTLLVISIDAIPTSYDELLQAVQGIPAFLLSFALLMMFWHGHWSWSRRYGLEDGPTILLSCALVFIVLCYVYPLKFLFQGMITWMTFGAVPSGLQRISGDELYAIFAIYGLGFVAMSVVLLLLYAHAYRHRVALGLNALELFDTRTMMTVWTILGGIGLLSIVLALVTPPSPIVLPGTVYMLLAVIMPVHGVWAARRRNRIAS